MRKINILKMLYKKSPMDFYNFADDNCTIIKSVNNTSLGYKFPKEFTQSDLDKVWSFIRLYKRVSTILIFLFFIFILYFVIFPNYSLLLSKNLNLSILVVLLAIFIIYYCITLVSTKVFETALVKEFGEYAKVKFKSTPVIDKPYYKLFKVELLKVGILLLSIVLFISLESPVKKAYTAVYNAQYKKVINITSIGAVAFPILPDWYSLRAYARFQLEDYEGAIADYDTAYRLSTDIFNTMNFDNKIYIKYYLKDYEGAIKDFDAEIKDAEGEFERDSFLWDKAQFLYNINRYSEALELYNELLTKADNDSVFLLKDRLYIERAQLHQVMGNYELANEDLINSEAIETLDEPLDYIPKPVLLLKEI